MSKRILILTEMLRQGGAESVSVNLANALVKRGGVVAVAAAPGELSSSLVPGVRFYDIPVLCFARIIQVFIKIRRVCADFKPDVIHCQGATLCLIAKIASVFASPERPLMVLTYHTVSTTRVPNFLSGVLFDWVSDRVIAIAQHRKQSMLRLGVPLSKISLIPNFIDTSLWAKRKASYDLSAFKKSLGFESDDRILLCSARVVNSKRIDLFLKTVAMVRKSDSRVKGVLLGDGPDMPDIRNLAVNLGIIEHVRFVGFQRDVMPYYLGADVFVFPTEREVLPMALVEAAAAGLPVVCSDIPGNAEVVVNEKNGFLLPADAQEYTDRVLFLLANDDTRKVFSSYASNLALTKFDEIVCVDQIMGVYEGELEVSAQAGLAK